MKIKHYSDIEPKIYPEPAQGLKGRILAGKDDGAKNFCMRLMELPPGTNTPLHTHEWEHEVFIHSGEGEVFCNGDWTPVAPGSGVFIPGGEEHQFRCAGGAPFFFVCVIPQGPPEL